MEIKQLKHTTTDSQFRLFHHIPIMEHNVLHQNAWQIHQHCQRRRVTYRNLRRRKSECATSNQIYLSSFKYIYWAVTANIKFLPVHMDYIYY